MRDWQEEGEGGGGRGRPDAERNRGRGTLRESHGEVVDVFGWK